MRVAPGHRRRRALRIGLLTAAALGASEAVCIAIRVVNPPTKTYRFVFPEGANGEYVLRCLVDGAASLPREDGFRLVRFGPQQRVIDTRDEYVFGNEWYEEQRLVEGSRGRRKVDATCRSVPSLAQVRVDVTCNVP